MRVLRLSGFSMEELGGLLRKASEQVTAGERFAVGAGEGEFGRDKPMRSRDDLLERLEDLPAFKRLEQLAKRSWVFNDDLSNPKALAKAIELVKEAVNPRRQVLEWMHAEATGLGLKVVPDRGAWIERASDEELDQDGGIIFLDDYPFFGHFNWHIVSQIARRLASTGHREALEAFGAVIIDDTLCIDKRIKDDVENAVIQAKRHDEFQRYVQAQAGNGELTQSDFLHLFVRHNNFEGSTFILENWLEGMATCGAIERYKRSGRWRIVVS